MEAAEARPCLVAIATYNEIDNLPQLIDEVFAAASHVRILVVDDNSPDGTGRWCQQRSRTDDRLECLLRPRKMGLGTAAVECMRYAIEHDFELLVTMDADLSHPPRYLPDLMRPFGRSTDVDVVIGSRYVAGGRVEGWPWHRRFMSRVMNWYTRILLGIAPRDCTGAFRCYRVDILRELALDQIESRGYSYLEEVLWRLVRQGATIAEVPIVFVNRQAGATKINLTESVAAVWLLLRLGLRK